MKKMTIAELKEIIKEMILSEAKPEAKPWNAAGSTWNRAGNNSRRQQPKMMSKPMQGGSVGKPQSRVAMVTMNEDGIVIKLNGQKIYSDTDFFNYTGMDFDAMMYDPANKQMRNQEILDKLKKYFVTHVVDPEIMDDSKPVTIDEYYQELNS